jgi:hypothetical protein
MIINWKTLNLKSMDILVCSGNGDLSKKIQWLNRLIGVKGEAALLSHACRIYKGYLCDAMSVIESTTLNAWANPPKRGVQKNNFEDWLNNYNGKVWVIQLNFDRTQEFYIRDYDFWKAHQNDPYESGILGYGELLLCELQLDRAVRWFWPSYKPLETAQLHCTELNVKFLKHHKLLNGVIASRLPPHEWWPDGDLYREIKCGVLEPVRIK